MPFLTSTQYIPETKDPIIPEYCFVGVIMWDIQKEIAQTEENRPSPLQCPSDNICASIVPWGINHFCSLFTSSLVNFVVHNTFQLIQAKDWCSSMLTYRSRWGGSGVMSSPNKFRFSEFHATTKNFCIELHFPRAKQTMNFAIWPATWLISQITVTDY